MRATRIFSVVVLLVAGLSTVVLAAPRITAPGTYACKIGIVPAALPDGGASLPPELQSAGPDLYVGAVTISMSGPNYFVQFQGSRGDGAKLNASATFGPAWTGFALGNLVVGASLESDCIVSIDSPDLISANLNGVGTVNGMNQRVVAKVGPNGIVTSFKILKAPGPLR